MPRAGHNRIDLTGKRFGRFVAPGVQSRNRRNNVFVEYNGERLVFKDFIIKYGSVSYETAKKRYFSGLSVFDSAFALPNTLKRRKKNG